MSSNARRAWVLVLTSVASLMVALDILVVSTALTPMRVSLNAPVDVLEWTVTAYNLSFAVLLMTASVLGDRYGRRRVFACGLTLFTVASAACALAPDAAWLIAARAFQGAGAAVVMPMGLALIGAAYPPEGRGKAFGIYGGVTGLATLGGPLVGGAVTQAAGWEWIFWINVPIGLIAIALVLARVQESRGPRASLDVPGLLLVTGFVLGLVWGLVRVNVVGWAAAEVIVAPTAGLVAGLAFVWWELRAPEPMLPMRLFRSRAFAAGNVATVMHAAVILGVVFLMAQFMQTTLGYGPLESGVRLIPWTATLLIVAPLAGTLTDRFGARPIMAGGMILAAAGMAWLALIARPGLGYAEMILPLLISGIGNSSIFPAVQSAVMGSVPEGSMGKAAGINSTIREIGGVLGIAALAAVFAAGGGYSSPQEFTDGFVPALWVATTLGLAGAAASLFVPGRSTTTGETAVQPPAGVPVVAGDSAGTTV